MSDKPDATESKAPAPLPPQGNYVVEGGVWRHVPEPPADPPKEPAKKPAPAAK